MGHIVRGRPQQECTLQRVKKNVRATEAQNPACFLQLLVLPCRCVSHTCSACVLVCPVPAVPLLQRARRNTSRMFTAFALLLVLPCWYASHTCIACPQLQRARGNTKRGATWEHL